MPSGRTHDLITFLLVPPTVVAAYYFTGDRAVTAIMTATMVFGGLMFGPDLDIQSKQYTRWGPLRFIWFPYKVALAHRSRLSHGILFGTLIRIVYFLAVVTILLAISLFIRDRFVLHESAGVSEMQIAFTRVWEIFRPIRRD